MQEPARHVEAVGEGDSPEDFSAAFEGAFARLRARVEPACAGGAAARWPLRVAAAVRASFAFAAEHPDAARLLTFEALSRGADGQAHHERLLAYFIERLRACRDGGPGCPEQASAIEWAIVGGVGQLVTRRLRTGHEAELPQLAEEAIEFVLTPYVGTRRARAISVSQQRSAIRRDE